MSFIPRTAPKKYSPEHIEDLEQRIFEALDNLEVQRINLEVLYAQPDKLTDGDVINADGTEYNPGSGKGPYYYNGSSLQSLVGGGDGDTYYITQGITEDDLNAGLALKVDKAYSEITYGLKAAITRVTSSVTLGRNYFTVLVNDDLASIAPTITLPSASSLTKQIFHIKKIGSTYNVTVSGGSGTIDGASSQIITTQYDSITVQSDGIEWFIL